jgi:hypothetical protein
MTNTAGNVYYYPNNMGRIILLAMEEILGHNGINAVLNMADLSNLIDHYPPNNLDLEFKFNDLSKIQATLEEAYGPRGGRGLALRSGRASFKYGLREFAPSFEETDNAYRLLPLNEKIHVGGQILMDTFNTYSDQRVRVEENKEQYTWHIDRCPLCWERQSDSPVCQFAVGLLQEALFWVSGGKFYIVEETHCIAKGDKSCTIAINKQPLE